MPVRHVPIVGWQPGPSGNCTYEPANIKAPNSISRHPVLIFNNTASSRHGATAIFEWPDDGLTLAQINVVAAADVASGNVVLDIETRKVRAGDSWNDAALTQNLTANVFTVPGTANTRPSTPWTIALAVGSYAKNDIVQVGVYRNKNNASDTAAGILIVHRIQLNWDK